MVPRAEGEQAAAAAAAEPPEAEEGKFPGLSRGGSSEAEGEQTAAAAAAAEDPLADIHADPNDPLDQKMRKKHHH